MCRTLTKKIFSQIIINTYNFEPFFIKKLEVSEPINPVEPVTITIDIIKIS